MTNAERLSHVYWLGGGSGAGKSTIAHRLAEAFDMAAYDTDAAMTDHIQRIDPATSPLLHDFLAANLDERWVRRAPAEMLATFHWFAGEGFDLIIDDLMAMPTGRRVIVDGFRLLPRLVEPLLPERSNAVWLLPTASFRKAVFHDRVAADHFTARTSDPDRALSNLLARDVMFTDRLRIELADRELTAIEVNDDLSEEELLGRVVDHFRLRSW